MSERVAGAPGVEFHDVWKKFSRGEHHDSLRDLIPALAKRLVGRAPPADELHGGDFWVLRDLTFSVRPGEALGIIGPNGAGKSTVLKLLTKILRPTRGRLHVEGRVGALIEVAAGFHPDLTGRENVFLQGAIMGMKRGEIGRKFDDIVDFSGISDFIDTPVKRYSSGMNARLGFSIAAHLDPEVLLIDEVLAVGDMSFQQRCYERLAEFRRSGIPIAFVSHNMQAIASVCDRGLLLRPGQAPLLADVSTVIAEYALGSRASADPRIEIRSARLVQVASGRTIQTPIEPGEHVELHLELRAVTDLPRCGMSLQVTRADGTLMFDGIPEMETATPADVPADATIHCSVRFRANLLRGTYLVGAVLFDEQRRQPNVRLPGLASFVVDERTRAGGCVELEPQARFTASVAKVA